MKLESSVVDVRSGGIQKSSKFRVASNAKSVRVLSSTLYQFKIRAIIRELSTNAIDAHIDAKNQHTPFEIQLPNTFAPEFRIRDFGTGISPEKIGDVYTVYFESDKDDSNEFTGALGLGSKSPFSYTESFTVNSFYGGIKYSYIANYGADGLPEINLMHSEPSDEHPGMEIKLAVPPKDFKEFESEAKNLIPWFKVQPKVTGVANFKSTPPKYKWTGPGWGIPTESAANDYYRDRKTYVVMGSIAYPLDAENIFGLDDKYKTLLNLGIHLFVNIGEVSMIASRENLEYTQRTNEALRKALQAMYDELEADLNGRFQNAKNLYEARKLYGSLNEPRFNTLKKYINPTFQGKSIATYFSFPSSGGITVGKGMNFSRRSNSYGTHKKVRASQCNSFECKESTLLVENDLKKGSHKASHYYLEQHQDIDNVVLVTFETDAERTEFLIALGADDKDMVKATALPQPPKVSVAGGGSGRAKFHAVYKADVTKTGRYTDRKDFWTEDTVDVLQGGVYVELSNYQPMKDGHALKAYNLLPSLNALIVSNIIPNFTLYGIKTISVGKFKRNPKWKNIYDYVKQNIEIYLQQNKLVDTMAESYEYENFGNKDLYVNLREKIKNGTVTLDSTKPFSLFMQELKDLEDIHKKYAGIFNTLLENSRHFGYNLVRPGASNKHNLNQTHETLMETHKVLKLISPYDMRDSKKARIVCEYIFSKES